MKLKIIDDKKFPLVDDTIQNDGTAKNAKGGTELMREALYKYVDRDLLDKYQIISSRVRTIDVDKPTILWMHDTWDDPECKRLSDPEFRKQFAKIVFVSHTQFQQFRMAHGITYDESIVIKNAIEPIKVKEKSKDIIKCIYHTTPHRGLDILIPAFEAVEKTFPNIQLDVYSSFEIYGWKERDHQYEDLFQKCIEHPKINYHGFQPNDVVRNALAESHIFTYPNIWPETSCIAAMEAMSAGCIPIHPNHEALPETISGFGIAYSYTNDLNKHANIFASLLFSLCEFYYDENLQNKINLMSIYANTQFNWQSRKLEWENLLKNIERI